MKQVCVVQLLLLQRRAEITGSSSCLHRLRTLTDRRKLIHAHNTYHLGDLIRGSTDVIKIELDMWYF